jgi:aspartyl/asparaginyl beta-hydroxylase (cupin superfamily)
MKPDATSADESVPFDETAVTRGRHKCYFCDVHRSDEWKFIARLNAFICKACQDRIEARLAEERKTG